MYTPYFEPFVMFVSKLFFGCKATNPTAPNRLEDKRVYIWEEYINVIVGWSGKDVCQAQKL